MFPLANYGGTCYINATLQCMFNDKYFKHFLEQHQQQQQHTSTLTLELAKQYKTDNMKCILQLLQAKMKKQLGNIYMQNDMHEFFILLIDYLHDECKVKVIEENTSSSSSSEIFLNSEWNKYHKYYTSPVIQIYYGQMLSQIQCSSCMKYHHNTEIFTELFLHTKCENGAENNVYDLLVDYFNGETIHDWICSYCNTKHQTVKKEFRITKYPLTLVLIIKRHNENISAPICLVRELNLPESMHIYTGEIQYTLNAFSSHYGSIAHGGHYIAHVFNKDVLHRIDDDVITVENESSSSSSSRFNNTYMLFYCL